MSSNKKESSKSTVIYCGKCKWPCVVSADEFLNEGGWLAEKEYIPDSTHYEPSGEPCVFNVGMAFAKGILKIHKSEMKTPQELENTEQSRMDLSMFAICGMCEKFMWGTWLKRHDAENEENGQRMCYFMCPNGPKGSTFEETLSLTRNSDHIFFCLDIHTALLHQLVNEGYYTFDDPIKFPKLQEANAQ